MLLTEIRTILLAQSLTGVTSATVFTGTMPSAPDACVVLYETGGSGPDFHLGDPAIAIEKPTIQIVVRGAPTDYETPRTVIERIYQTLPTLTPFTQSGTSYLNIEPLQSPFLFKRDERNRISLVCNFYISKLVSTVA